MKKSEGSAILGPVGNGDSRNPSQFTPSGTLIMPPEARAAEPGALPSQSGGTLLFEPVAIDPARSGHSEAISGGVVGVAPIIQLAGQSSGPTPNRSEPELQRGGSSELRGSGLLGGEPGTPSRVGGRGTPASTRVSGGGHLDRTRATTGRHVPEPVNHPEAEPAHPTPAIEKRQGTQAAERKPLFRERALRARFEDQTGMALPSVSRPRWAGLLLLCSLAVALLAFAGLGRLEVTSKAIGGLRVADGPRPITAQVSGVVSSLSVRAGERVEAEHALAKIEARELSARVERSVRQVELLRDEASEAKQTTASLQDKTIVALEQKRGLLWQRAKLKQQQVTARQGHAERVAELVRQGAASGVEAMAAQEQVAVAKEELLALREEAATIGVQIADREHSYGADRVERDFRVREAEVGLAEARALAVLGIVSAPESGRVESLLVSEGQVIQAGTVLARIVPDGQASGVVVFAPAKDAAFLHPGLEASLEFPSLPVGEYGKAKARVTRVAEDLALPEEVSEVLGPDAGDEGGVVRVELTLVRDQTWQKMAPRLRSGARVVARLKTRKQRIATLLFDFLRAWYPS